MRTSLIAFTGLVLIAAFFIRSKPVAEVEEIRVVQKTEKALFDTNSSSTKLSERKLDETTYVIPEGFQKKARTLARVEPKNKRSNSEIVDDFQTQPLKENDLLLVTNYFAELNRDSSEGQVVNGYDIVRTSAKTEANIILNKETGKFGVWTREIVVKGSPQDLKQLEERWGLNKIKGGEESIYGVPDSVGLDQVYSDLGPGVQVRPDIRYSRAKLQ